MDKLEMRSEEITQENIKKIRELFPNAVTEAEKDGKITLSIDFDVLKQELSDSIIAEGQERYQMTWPGKKQSVLLANSSITDTLRPCKEESVDFDNTQNLYIEGDNLNVLKLLRETYLGKVKMIYIDPPYNTGNDFIYKDDFAKSSEEWKGESGDYDELGNRLVKNPDSNGRYHSDWLSMLYPRLRLARDLLTDDGVIFISIDDNEQANLKKICDEVFGESNFIGSVVWSKKRKGSFLSKGIISLTEYLMVYSKTVSCFTGLYGGEADSTESQPIIKRTNKISTLAIPANVIFTKLEDGVYKKGVYGDEINPVELLNDIEVKCGKILSGFSIKAPFIWSQAMLDLQLAKGAKLIINTINFQIRAYKAYDENNFKGFPSYLSGVEIKGTNEDAYEELENIFGLKKLFDYSKPKNYIKTIINGATHFDKNSIILDFFSGSATTAHAVMQLNAEDGGNRKFIMVQLPEKCDEKSEAFKAGYKNICEIGKERIRRAGKKIKEENGLVAQNLDIGFRVLKLDSSNMQDVYYNPSAMRQSLLDTTIDNIKPDRTPLDLLFQVMLSLGMPLSSKIEEKQVNGKTYYAVNGNDIIACFDDNIDEEVITAIAKLQPIYAVFKDKSFATDSVGINNAQLFATYSPATDIKVI